MSIVARIAPCVKPTPARRTVVLFDATRPHPSPYFGRGLTPGWRGEFRHCPFTAADAAFAAEAFADEPSMDELNAELAEMYEESRAISRLEMGLDA